MQTTGSLRAGYHGIAYGNPHGQSLSFTQALAHRLFLVHVVAT